MKTTASAAALLALAACAVEPPAPNAADVAGAAATPPPAVPAAPPSAADDGAPPAPGELETFRDWTVACDNAKRCAMASLGAEGGEFPTYVMEVARAAGGAGGFEISVTTRSDDAAAPAALANDGRRFQIAPDGLSGEAAMRIAAAMVNGKALSVADAKGRVLGGVSLAGAAAALRYIDAQQGRAGTVTAAVARGERPADAVPPAPPIPLVVAPALAGKAATPGASQLADMRRVAKCEDRMADASVWSVRTAAIGGGATLVLLPCSAGAYNQIDALFVLRDGRIAPADVDAPSGFEETGADTRTPVHSVVNGEVENGVLRSYAKGRGLGDCGVTQSYVWDGRRLRLTEQRAMGECRGNADYLRTWIARVERR